MTLIPEEPIDKIRESEEEMKRRREEAQKRGQEVVIFVQKEVTEIDAGTKKLILRLLNDLVVHFCI